MSIPVIGGPGFNGPGAEDDPMASDGKIHVLFQSMTESYLEQLVRNVPQRPSCNVRTNGARSRIALALRQSEGLTLETSALKLFTVANLHYQLS